MLHGTQLTTKNTGLARINDVAEDTLSRWVEGLESFKNLDNGHAISNWMTGQIPVFSKDQLESHPWSMIGPILCQNLEPENIHKEGKLEESAVIF